MSLLLKKAKEENAISLRDYLEYYKLALSLSLSIEEINSSLNSLFKRLILDEDTKLFLLQKGQYYQDFDQNIVQEIKDIQKEFMQGIDEDREEWKDILEILYQELRETLNYDYSYEYTISLQRRKTYEQNCTKNT